MLAASVTIFLNARLSVGIVPRKTKSPSILTEPLISALAAMRLFSTMVCSSKIVIVQSVARSSIPVLLKFVIRPPLTESPLIAISFCFIAEKFILLSGHDDLSILASNCCATALVILCVKSMVSILRAISDSICALACLSNEAIILSAARRSFSSTSMGRISNSFILLSNFKLASKLILLSKS